VLALGDELQDALTATLHAGSDEIVPRSDGVARW